jgi:hypothetical protein
LEARRLTFIAAHASSFTSAATSQDVVVIIVIVVVVSTLIVAMVVAVRICLPDLPPSLVMVHVRNKYADAALRFAPSPSAPFSLSLGNFRLSGEDCELRDK